MRNYLIIMISIFYCASSFAASKSWSNLYSGESYKLDRDIGFSVDNELKLKLNKGSSLILIERISLGMIKVELFKFKLNSYCTDQTLTTDIELIDVVQAGNKNVVVGYDLAEECILEMFVEMHEVKYRSTFF